MAQFALLKNSDDSIVQEVDGDKRFRSGQPPVLKTEKGLRWSPLVIVDPPFSQRTQVRSGPAIVVTGTEVTKTWTVRSKNAQEIDEDDTAVTDALFQQRDSAALVKALNDGTFVPGSNYSDPEMRAIIKAVL